MSRKTGHVVPFPKKLPRSLMMTSTGEPYMPVRLYCQVIDKHSLLQALNVLTCIQRQGNKFSIYYHEEALLLALSVQSNPDLKDLEPLLIAKGTIIDEQSLQIDVSSVVRAIEIAKFINKYIGHNNVQITHAASYNQLSMVGAKLEAPEQLFSESRMAIFDAKESQKVLRDFINSIKGLENEQELLENFFAHLDFPVVEKFPVHYHEDGILAFEFNLQSKMAVAIERWNRNKNAKPIDVIRKMLQDDLKIM